MDLITKVLEIIGEHFNISKKRLNLFFLLIISLIIVYGCFTFFGYSLKDTLLDGLFWIVIGALFIMYSVLEKKSFRQKCKKIWPWLVFLLLGLSSIFVGYFLIFHTLPKDKLVIAIALNPVAPSDENIAEKLSYQIDYLLRKKSSEGVPMIVKRLHKKVIGLDEESRRKKAISICKSGENAAHVILWGDVLTVDNKVNVELRLSIVRQLLDTDLKDTKIEYGTIFPQHFELKDLHTEIADQITIIYGLAYYKTQSWQKALNIFKGINSDKALLYEGFCLNEIGLKESNSNYFKQSIEVYDKVIGDKKFVKSIDETAFLAYINKANSYANLGDISENGFYKIALDIYKQGLEFYSPTNHFDRWFLVKGNYGTTLLSYSYTLPENMREKILLEVVDLFKELSGYYNKIDNDSLLKTKTNLGYALLSLSKLRSSNKNKIKITEEALNSYKEALLAISKKENPDNWSKLQYHIGIGKICLSELNIDKHKKIKLLKDVIKDLKRAVKAVNPKNTNLCALIKATIGKAKTKLGILIDDEVYDITLIQEGIADLDEALLLKPLNNDIKTIIFLNRGNANIRMSEKVEESKKVKYLTKALNDFEKALCVSKSEENFEIFYYLGQIYYNLGYISSDKVIKESYYKKSINELDKLNNTHTRLNNPIGWADARSRIGYIYGELGTSISVDKQNVYLANASEAFSDSLKVYSIEYDPKKWAEIQLSLGEVKFYQAVNYKNITKNLNLSLNCYNKALNVLTLKDNPEKWGRAYMNIACSYVRFLDYATDKDKKEYASKAIEACNNALEVYSYEKNPSEWLSLQNNMGLALLEMGNLTRDEEFYYKAHQAFNNFLSVIRKDEQIEDWARLQSCLGNLMRDWGHLIGGEKGIEKLKESLNYYEQANSIFNEQEYPNENQIIQLAKAKTAKWYLDELEKQDPRVKELREMWKKIIGDKSNH